MADTEIDGDCDCPWGASGTDGAVDVAACVGGSVVSATSSASSLTEFGSIDDSLLSSSSELESVPSASMVRPGVCHTLMAGSRNRTGICVLRCGRPDDDSSGWDWMDPDDDVGPIDDVGGLSGRDELGLRNAVSDGSVAPGRRGDSASGALRFG